MPELSSLRCKRIPRALSALDWVPYVPILYGTLEILAEYFISHMIFSFSAVIEMESVQMAST